MKKTATTIMTLLALLILLLTATGCHTTKKTVKETETHIRTDTTTTQESDSLATETTDSTIITQRMADVEVPIPQVHLERETSDTSSTLETDLYRSTATIIDGKLHHTLETQPDARLNATIPVADTTKIHRQVTTRKTRHDTASKSQQKDTQSQVTRKTITKWPWWAYTAIAAATAALLYFIYRATRRRMN